MLDKFMERMLENVASVYMLKFKDIANTKALELASMKEKVRTCPEEVEAWFDKEIEKVNNLDIAGAIEKMKIF
ncbi:MAG TPA: hypothetical protein VFD60_01370 [Nitrososphaeraceae archaeon]|nr:hypothetical protein [Nitrososphaeraceae archaeon]